MKKITTIGLTIGIILVLFASSMQGFSTHPYEYENRFVSSSLVSPVTTLLDENYYVWEDTFANAQKIDEQHSEHFIINDGSVQMYGTFPQWTDADWLRMKEITIESNVAIDDCVIKLIIDYDSDMKTDYSDLRFKFNDDDYWLPYWIEEINPEPNDPYAIIWLRIASMIQGISTIYLFYDNPIAGYQGDYWSVFDENSWQCHYPHDHKVTYHMENEGSWDPAVTWGDNRFFLAWEEGIPRYLPLGMIYKQQIRGCFYDEDGNLLGTRFDITPWNSDPLTSFRNEDPAVAYGSMGQSKHFFIAYEHYKIPGDLLSRDINGVIVPSTAQDITDITSVSICSDSENQEDPCVSYDSDNHRFFVVWADAREGTSNYNIYGRLYTLNGETYGSEKVISSRPNSQCEPWITYDDVNNHYMIVWEEGINPETGPFEIWGQLFTVNGDPLGDAQLLSPEGQAADDYNFPCVAYCDLTERFLITWQEDDISSGIWEGHIWGKILDENGNTVVDTFKIANGAFERTNVVPHLSSSFFVVYDGNGDIWGKLVSSTGDVNPYVLQLSDEESNPADWASIGSSGEKIFVSWEDTRVEYPEPYDGLGMPDVYANVWSFNTPSGSDTSYVLGEEKSCILESWITSVPIAPENLESWYEFHSEKQGDVMFHIVSADDPSIILQRDISSGASIQSIQDRSIRLQARFFRTTPASSPLLEQWNVSYVGKDEQSPVTTVQMIEGVKGLNDWYISESVILWLHAEDYPKDTGSGIEGIYYTLNGGDPQLYNMESGLQLLATQSSHWMGEWDIVFWAVDNSGNIENQQKPENTRSIKIDAERPHIQITSPADEEQVEVPFWVRVNPSDNVGVDRVEFDIEPFGERDGLPYVDTDPPYEWHCDVEESDDWILDSIGSLGVNVMVRAQVFDASGQSWIHQVWVYITNWRDADSLVDACVFVVGISDENVGGLSRYDSSLMLPTWRYFEDINWEFSPGYGLIYDADHIHMYQGGQQGSARSFIGLSTRFFILGVAESITIEH